MACQIENSNVSVKSSNENRGRRYVWRWRCQRNEMAVAANVAIMAKLNIMAWHRRCQLAWRRRINNGS